MFIVTKLWAKWIQIKKAVDNAILKLDGATGKEAQIEFLINGLSKGFLKCDSSGNLKFTSAINLQGAVDCDSTLNVDGQANFNSTLILKEGEGVASDATLALGAGNIFKVTGTTNITDITPHTSGLIIILIFSGVLTVVTGSNIRLGSDFVTTPSDSLMLVYQSSSWKQLGRNVL